MQREKSSNNTRPIFKSFPYSINSLTIAIFPFEAALCIGVAPLLSVIFISAYFSSNATHIDFQFFDAAYCNAECPSTVVALTFAPSASKVLTTFSRPAEAARINGVIIYFVNKMIGNKILFRYLIKTNSSVFRYSVITKKKFNERSCLILPLATNRLFHIAQNFLKEEKTKKNNTLMTSMFENTKEKKKDTFLEIIRTYEQEKYKRGQLEFIKLALKYMEVYGIHKDLEAYKALLNIFPKGPYIPKNYFNAVFRYYPKHQDVATDVLQQMEDNRVIPDEELENILLNTFGKHARPLKKLWRMLYWMPKFVNLNPWPVPNPIPTDPKILARIAIQKISSIDVTAVTSEFETKDIKESIEDTWIISAISPIQKNLLVQHLKLRKDMPMYVEGPFKIWVANQSVDYFILRADPIKSTYEYENPDDVSKIKIPFWKTNEIVVAPTVHEQEDGVYFAVCATGTSSKDSAISWIRYLQKDNPVLEKIPILIKLTSSVETECIIFTKEQKNLQKRSN
ncbi:hypothetical protein V1478_012932 [Vespula squamosa]|uniref:Evolutionarily conserved signaling intermediate in Toll pathway, mitochondrial n=1 Tax=Vespula squamosa TaxID=30214 RepID=A0ABD2AA86_VESSQ